MKPAVFLDRDGTIIEHVHHLNRVQDVRLIPGSADAIRLLRYAGFLCVGVTNQSVVGRGLLDLGGLAEIHDEMAGQLATEQTQLDGLYFCTEVPKGKDQTVVEHPDRKPGPGMLTQAAKELGIDLAQSWMIGDSVSDIEAGRNAGCREALLVLTGYGERVLASGAYEGRSFATLAVAARAILEDSKSQARS